MFASFLTKKPSFLPSSPRKASFLPSLPLVTFPFSPTSCLSLGVLPYAFHHVLKDADEKTRGSCHRLLNIWEERGVYGAGFIQAIKHTKDSGSGGGGGGGEGGGGAAAAAGSGSAGGGVSKGRNEIVPILKHSRTA